MLIRHAGRRRVQGGAVSFGRAGRGRTECRHTDTDTDRVPSHTSRRDRRDDQHWRNPSRTFSRSAYDESPARCWRPSVRLERARRAPDQGRRAPIANRVRMGPRQLSCYRPPDPRILSRRRRIWSRGGRTRRPGVGRKLSARPETQHPPVGGEVLIGPCREPPPLCALCYVLIQWGWPAGRDLSNFG